MTPSSMNSTPMKQMSRMVRGMVTVLADKHGAPVEQQPDPGNQLPVAAVRHRTKVRTAPASRAGHRHMRNFLTGPR